MLRLGRKILVSLASIAAVAVALVGAAPANASFHIMQIRAVYEGPMNGGFIELQMYAGGQNFVNGQLVRLYSNSTNTINFLLNHDVANGANQSTILIGDDASLSPDFPEAGAIHNDLAAISSAGAVCYGSIDCVTFGSFNNFGLLPSPAADPISGLSTSMVASRSIARGCATALDAADDTNDSAADFSYGVGFPVRNNATAPTEVLCSTSTPITTTPTTATFNLKAAIRKCKKRFPKGPKRKRCIRKAKLRAQA